MKYFFVLGSNQAISYAELLAVIPDAEFSLPGSTIAIAETEASLNADQLIKRLGGTIKIGEIVSETNSNTDSMLSAIKPLAMPGAGKYKFGFSYYGPGRLNLKPLGMELKKYLSESGASCRWVTSKDPTLSSVVVEQNGLLKNGAEFVLIRSGNKLSVGKTCAVQPFKELETRDFGRPARDDLSGMLPPKLAQILINLTRANTTGTLLDPFCGSGTLVTEAALMGYEHVYGSDLSEKAIEDSKKNFAWVKTKFALPHSDFLVRQIDSTQISKSLPSESIDAIATEPYLGPQRGKVDTRAIVKELEVLYADSLSQFEKILKASGRIAMIWPVFNTPSGRIMLSQKIIGKFKIISPLPREFSSLPGTTGRQTLLYGREGQKVWREIVVLAK